MLEDGFYTDVLGGRLIRSGEPSYVTLANSWIIINVGGGPTDDKPFLTPPKQHQTEIRRYLRDPDGHVIEVGHTTLPGGSRKFLMQP